MLKKPALIGIIVVVVVIVVVAVVLGLVYGLKKKPSGPSVTWYNPTTVWQQWGQNGQPPSGAIMGPYLMAMNGDTGNVWTTENGIITVEPLTDLTDTSQHFYLFSTGSGSWGDVYPAFVGSNQTGGIISVNQSTSTAGQIQLTSLNATSSPYPFVSVPSTAANCEGLLLFSNSNDSTDCCWYINNQGQNQFNSPLTFTNPQATDPSQQQCSSFSTVSMGFISGL